MSHDLPTEGSKPRNPRGLQVAHCSLCGITLPLGLMVPDGGQACADIRWYCHDARSCTERWTAQQSRPVRVVLAPGSTSASAEDAPSAQSPDEAAAQPANRPGELQAPLEFHARGPGLTWPSAGPSARALPRGRFPSSSFSQWPERQDDWPARLPDVPLRRSSRPQQDRQPCQA